MVACFRVAADKANGWRYGVALASAAAPIVRSADAIAASGPTSVASDTSSSAQSMARARSPADSVPNPKSMTTGPSAVTRMLAARSDRCARRAAWIRSTCCHVWSSSAASIAWGGSVSSGRPSTYSTASAMDPSGNEHNDRSVGDVTEARLER